MLVASGSFIAYVTPDGMQWLDPDGNQPVLDNKGRLREPFILATYEPDGITAHRKERWLPPARLPLTPTALKVGIRPTSSETDAGLGNSEGDSMAIAEPPVTPKAGTSKPAPKPGKKSTREKAIARTTTPVAPSKVKDKPAVRANVDGAPSKPANGIVYIRHMRNPRDAFILIKNVSVFGVESNWATKEEFKTADAAEEWAKRNGLRVVNKK